MDDVYENTVEILGCHRKFKREPYTSEDIYMNQQVIQTVQHEPTGFAPPGAEFVKKSSCRAAVILLGLLCLFLLIGLIAVVSLFTQGKSQWEMETVMLHKLVDNVTSERNQLQASYNILTTKQDQLQASYNILKTKQDQLQASYNILKTKQDQLQASYNNLVKEREQHQKRLEDMTTNRDDLQRKLQDYEQNGVAFNGSLFHISSMEKSWEESRQDCLQKGSDLMIINSREEQNFVNQFKKRLWIGLTDSETEGTWKWVDGTQMNTSYWNNGEPNGGKNENCGHIDTYNLENSWNDARCSILHFWICEKRVSP